MLLMMLADELTETQSDNAGSTASGFLHRLESFQVLFNLNLISFESWRLLQSPLLSVAEARNMAEIATNVISKMRNDSTFQELYNEVLRDSNCLGVNSPSIP